MSEFARHLASRLPQSWAGRIVWIILGVSACWAAYQFAHAYNVCRSQFQIPQAYCFESAFFTVFYKSILFAYLTAGRLLNAILP